VLRANRRLLRTGGRLAYLVIEVSPGLDRRRRRRANSVGPRHVATASNYQSMMRTAGFVGIERIDVTREYRDTATGWLSQRRLRADELCELMGDETHREKVRDGEATIVAIDDGLIRRSLYLARRP
jgi:hypothetical protein